jgi:hypothetical protein
VLTAAAMFWLGPRHPEDPVPTGLYVVFAASALWCVAWALFASAERRANSSSDVASGQLGWSIAASRPPEPNETRGVGLRFGLLFGVLLVLGAVGGAAVTAYRQVSVDAQQRAARTVTAAVIGHPDEFTVRVAYPNSASTDIGVLETAGYPVDSQVRLAVDDRGLVQLIAEPYDITLFYSLAIVAGLFGVALLWRARDFSAPRRRLFREPQPESVVYIRRRSDRVLLFAGNAGPTETPFAEIPVRDDLLGLEGTPGTFKSPYTRAPFIAGTFNASLFGLNPDQVAAHPESAVLYGRPVRDQWCTVRVGGQTLFPSGPLRATLDTVPFGAGATAGSG